MNDKNELVDVLKNALKKDIQKMGLDQKLVHDMRPSEIYMLEVIASISGRQKAMNGVVSFGCFGAWISVTILIIFALVLIF